MDELEDVVECVDHPNGLTLDIVSGANHVHMKQIKYVMTGMSDMGKALHTLSDAVEVCHPEITEDQLNEVNKMIDHLENDTSLELMYTFGEDILVNGMSIWHEIADARTQIDQKNWKQFGRNIGEIINLVF